MKAEEGVGGINGNGNKYNKPKIGTKKTKKNKIKRKKRKWLPGKDNWGDSYEVRGFLLRGWKCAEIRSWRWLYTREKIQKSTELYSSNQ